MQLETHWPAPATPTGESPAAPRAARVRRAAVATIAAGVVAAAVGLGRPLGSIGLMIVIAATAVAATRAGVIAGRPRTVVIAATGLFLPWLAIRSSPWLLVPDVIAAVVLVVVATSSRNGSPLRDSASGYARRARTAAGGAVIAPRRAVVGLHAGLSTGWRTTLRQSAGPAALGLAIAVGVALLLASGDAVFASYLAVGDAAATAGRRFVAAATVMTVVVAVSGAAAASESRPPIPARRRGDGRSAVFVMAPLTVVYVAFVAVQCSSVLLGADYVRDRTGLTFAEYARSGFFQLVAVAIVSFGALALLRPIVRSSADRHRRTLRSLAVVATACTLVMVVAAIVKLDLYADAFGLTMLRMYTSVFAAWLGVALVIGLCSLFRPDGEWVVAVVAFTALAGVFGMNLVHPERIVTEHNLTATIDSPEFDIAYLLGLSDDTVPTIVAHLDELDAVDRDRAVRRICRSSDRSGWLDWNHSVHRARSAAHGRC